MNSAKLSSSLFVLTVIYINLFFTQVPTSPTLALPGSTSMIFIKTIQMSETLMSVLRSFVKFLSQDPSQIQIVLTAILLLLSISVCCLSSINRLHLKSPCLLKNSKVDNSNKDKDNALSLLKFKSKSYAEIFRNDSNETIPILHYEETSETESPVDIYIHLENLFQEFDAGGTISDAKTITTQITTEAAINEIDTKSGSLDKYPQIAKRKTFEETVGFKTMGIHINMNLILICAEEKFT